MKDSEMAIVIMNVVMILIFLGFLLWGIKSGQFKDIEEAKYSMLGEEEE